MNFSTYSISPEANLLISQVVQADNSTKQKWLAVAMILRKIISDDNDWNQYLYSIKASIKNGMSNEDKLILNIVGSSPEKKAANSRMSYYVKKLKKFVFSNEVCNENIIDDSVANLSSQFEEMAIPNDNVSSSNIDLPSVCNDPIIMRTRDERVDLMIDNLGIRNCTEVALRPLLNQLIDNGYIVCPTCVQCINSCSICCHQDASSNPKPPLPPKKKSKKKVGRPRKSNHIIIENEYDDDEDDDDKADDDENDDGDHSIAV